VEADRTFGGVVVFQLVYCQLIVPSGSIDVDTATYFPAHWPGSGD
jgi:hypothetical protein